jgi:hypothetical protein
MECKTKKVGDVAPVVNNTTVTPSGSVLNVYSPTDTTIFSANFSQDIARAPTPGYIRIFSATTNQSVLVLDASNSTIASVVNKNTLQINMPVGQLNTGSYYILFDYGK